jgi:O-antigen ligase
MWWFALYVGIYVLSVFRVPPEFLDLFAMRILTLVQLLVFFWVTADLMKNDSLAKLVLLTYSVAAAIFAVGILLRVPGFSQEIVPGRVTGAGENLNAAATHMAIAVVAAVGLLLSRFQLSSKLKVVLGAVTVPSILAMISTGSRGGIVAFVAGLLVYLLPYWKKKHNIIAVAGCAVALIGVILLIKSTPDLMARWEESYYEGKLSDRENIFLDTISMISEQPLFGWGPIEYGFELGSRKGSLEPNDTHNLVLHLLAEVGVVGAIPFLIGVGLALYHAWTARLGVFGLLPFAILVTILTANMSGNNLVWKPQWLMFALIASRAVPSARGSMVRMGKGYSTARPAGYRRRLGISS